MTATDNNGVKTTYNYSTLSKGLPTSVSVEDSTNVLRTATYYTYTDDYNYLTSVIDASGAQTQYTYDTAKGLVTKTTDPNGNETVYEYDPNNDRLLSISNPTTEAETEFLYNASGQTTQISNSDVEYNLSYDAFGRPTGVNILGTTLSINSYNTENQLAGTVFGNGDSVEYAYNEDKLLSSVKYDGVLSYEYFYTSQNQVGKLVDHDNDVTWEYFYDMAGRLTDVESDDGKKIEYGYDSKGNPGTFTVKDGTSTLSDIGYSYDSQNRPSAVTVNSMTGQPSQSYVYDSLGRIVSYENTTDSANPQNKITRSFSYQTSSGLQTNKIGSMSYANTSDDLYLNYSYEYDDNGNITNVSGANLEIYYVYDSLNRLVTEDSSVTNKRVNYAYDKNGDILSKTEYDYITGETETFTYQYGDADCPNGLTSYNGETVTYDANGNPLTYRGYTMTWEKGRQLASMTKNGTTLSFKYDATGLRTEKTSGSTTTEYTYVGEKLVSMKSGSTVMNFSYGADGSPYGFTYNETSYFYLLNLQGDVIGIHDASGNVVTRYNYDAWGKLVSTTASNSVVALSNPLRYRGYVYDTETSLYYLQSRYYDPETGRFINADSLLVAGDYLQGTNMFAYCLNNPVMYSDPSGRQTVIEYYSSSEMVAINVTTIIICLVYIADYAEKNGKDINAIHDFLGRVIDEGDTLDDVAKALKIGANVLSGNHWWLYSGAAGTFLDALELSGKYIPGIIGESANALQLYTSLMADRYNPLMFNDEVAKNMLIHIVDIAGGVGIAKFSVDLAAAVTAATGGNVIVGGLTGFAFYLGGTYVWDEYVNA